MEILPGALSSAKVRFVFCSGPEPEKMPSTPPAIAAAPNAAQPQPGIAAATLAIESPTVAAVDIVVAPAMPEYAAFAAAASPDKPAPKSETSVEPMLVPSESIFVPRPAIPPVIRLYVELALLAALMSALVSPTALPATPAIPAACGAVGLRIDAMAPEIGAMIGCRTILAKAVSMSVTSFFQPLPPPSMMADVRSLEISVETFVHASDAFLAASELACDTAFDAMTVPSCCWAAI